MRGHDTQQPKIFSYVALEERVPADHPLRAIRPLVDEVLRGLARRFEQLYARTGRPSIPPERLLRALLLQLFYSVRSERLLVEQLNYNLLFRWFVGLEMDEEVWNHAVFSKNRQRLLNEELAGEFFCRVLELARPYLSDEHFTVDGTLIEAWASQKSFRPKDHSQQDGRQFRGQRRTNQTHQSTTDPEARLYRKGPGQEARLAYLGHVLVENRQGLIVEAMATAADGTAEADAALLMAQRLRQRQRGRLTLAADRAYDQRELVRTLRELGVVVHAAQNDQGRRSALDGRTTRHLSYQLSQRRRPLVERVFAWWKWVAGLKRIKLRGLAKVNWLVKFAAAAYNLWRLPKLEGQSA
jgi:transposase